MILSLHWLIRRKIQKSISRSDLSNTQFKTSRWKSSMEFPVDICWRNLFENKFVFFSLHWRKDKPKLPNRGKCKLCPSSAWFLPEILVERFFLQGLIDIFLRAKSVLLFFASAFLQQRPEKLNCHKVEIVKTFPDYQVHCFSI